jgi:hypothetical protein
MLEDEFGGVEPGQRPMSAIISGSNSLRTVMSHRYEARPMEASLGRPIVHSGPRL